MPATLGAMSCSLVIPIWFQSEHVLTWLYGQNARTSTPHPFTRMYLQWILIGNHPIGRCQRCSFRRFSRLSQAIQQNNMKSEEVKRVRQRKAKTTQDSILEGQQDLLATSAVDQFLGQHLQFFHVEKCSIGMLKIEANGPDRY